MAYVSVSEWRPEQVTEWLKGLDLCVTPYLHWFSNNEVNGQQLLNLSPDELTSLGVHKIGHQELILGAVEHLRNFHYELDRENLQLLALRVSCAAHSLYNEIKHKAETTSVPTRVMADVANVINHVKPLVSWLDRPPFSGQIEPYAEFKSQLLRISLEMATCAQRDTFAERPISEIRNCSSKLAKLADSIIQDLQDPMILQPASLDLATIKKRVGEDLGFFLIHSFHGIHQISDMKLSSPAHQSGKIQPGDEVVQVNYQTVVGWSRNKVLALFDESPNDLLLTLKRRPRHVKMYGQIYMKPYRLPSRKRASPYARWNDNVPSPRPELLTLPPINIPRMVNNVEKTKKNEEILSEPSSTSSSSDEEFGQSSDSKNSVSLRLYLNTKPRAPIQRRFTLSGPPRPSAQSEQFWRELQLERSWRSNQNNSQLNNSNSDKLNKNDGSVDDMFQLRDKSASLGNSIATAPPRPSTCISFSKSKIGSVKFDLPKPLSPLSNSGSRDKVIAEERDKVRCDKEANESSTFASADKHNGNVGDHANISAMNLSNKMTISELNKIKRDAFFNNMDSGSVPKCATEDSSEKVKRIIENFKSEVSNIKMEITEPDIIHTPGKVSQLIGSFERKEIGMRNRPENDEINIPRRNKGIGDENHAASDYIAMKNKPIEGRDDESDAVKFTGFNRSISSLDLQKTENEPESHGQMVNTINDFLLPDRDYYGSGDYKTKDCAKFVEDYDSHDSNGSESDYRDRSEARGIVDTVNLALVELKQRQDHYDVRDKQKEESISLRSEYGKEISSSSSINRPEVTRHESNINKPIPTQRKSKMQPEKPVDNGFTVGPLPPKPRPRVADKPSEIMHTPSGVKPPVKSRTPPEPPPRPESTLSKPRKPEVRENRDSPQPIDVKRNDIFTPVQQTSVPIPSVPSIILENESGGKIYDVKQLPASTTPTRELSSKSSHSGRGPAVLNIMTEKPKSSGSPLGSLKAMLSLGRKPLSFSSPRSVRKKTAMLARKRNVSVKDVSPGENSGILWHRNRKAAAAAPWSKFYFVLQGLNFYGFKTKDSQKADLFIHLPGFTCTVAEEVKSREFAFKIYHTGTAFYFAANSKEDLQQWLDCVSVATIYPDDKQVPETVTFSVSDSDSSDTEREPETCFPTSPKMKKFLGSSPVPKPARSHQNLASDSKKTYDIQKRFGSLKKLSSQKHSANHSSGNNESGSSSNSEIASLDRKYLRFLGHKNNPLPVPTSQFRSYRRMQPTTTATPPVVTGKSNEKNENINKNIHHTVSWDYHPGLVRRTLHMSNPSLIHPDMADYRITQERLAEFRRLRNQESGQDGGGYMTLEQFMTSQQEEETSVRSNRSRPPELRGFMTLEQFLLMQEEEQNAYNWSNRISEQSDAESEGTAEQQQEEERRRSNASRTRCYPRGEHSATSVSQSRSCNFEKVDNSKVKPRASGHNSKHSLRKYKSSWKNESTSSAGPSTEAEDCTCAACESSLVYGVARSNAAARHSSEEDDSKFLDCPHVNKDPTPDYPGIEYPPAFEPETYTLQYMLKNRRKRNTSKSKKEDR